MPRRLPYLPFGKFDHQNVSYMQEREEPDFASLLAEAKAENARAARELEKLATEINAENLFTGFSSMWIATKEWCSRRDLNPNPRSENVSKIEGFAFRNMSPYG